MDGEDGRSTGRKDDLEPTAFSKRESPRGAGERPRAEPVFEPRGLKAHRRRGQVKRQLPDRLPLSTTVTKTVVA